MRRNVVVNRANGIGSTHTYIYAYTVYIFYFWLLAFYAGSNVLPYVATPLVMRPLPFASISIYLSTEFI